MKWVEWRTIVAMFGVGHFVLCLKLICHSKRNSRCTTVKGDSVMDTEEERLLQSCQTRFETWKKKRKWTTVIFIAFGFLLGVEYSAVVLSLWFFIKDTIKSTHAPMMYSVSMMAMAFSASLSGIVFGRFIDRSRNIRAFMMVINFCGAFGNIIYSMNFSIAFPIIGRLICGMSDSIAGAISGEFSRVYPPDELVVILSKYQTIYSFGFVVGPATSLLFENVDFYIGEWHLNSTNFIGVFMAITILLFNILVYFGVTNLSVEYDLKSGRETKLTFQKNGNNNTLSKYGNGKSTININARYSDKSDDDNCNITLSEIHGNNVMTLKDIFTNVDILLIDITAGVVCYTAVNVELLIPLSSSKNFQWSQFRVSIILTVTVVVYVILMFTCCGRLLKSTRLTLHLFLCSVVMTAVGPFLLIFPEVFTIKSIYLQVTIISLTILMNSLAGLTSMALSRAIILNMAPSNSASFCEGVRAAFARSLSVIGFFNAGLIISHLKYASPITMFVLLILSVSLFRRRASFQQPINFQYNKF